MALGRGDLSVDWLCARGLGQDRPGAAEGSNLQAHVEREAKMSLELPWCLIHSTSISPRPCELASWAWLYTWELIIQTGTRSASRWGVLDEKAAPARQRWEPEPHCHLAPHPEPQSPCAYPPWGLCEPAEGYDPVSPQYGALKGSCFLCSARSAACLGPPFILQNPVGTFCPPLPDLVSVSFKEGSRCFHQRLPWFLGG